MVSGYQPVLYIKYLGKDGHVLESGYAWCVKSLILKDNIEDFDDLSLNDSDVIFSVTGYVARYVECDDFVHSEVSPSFEVLDLDRTLFNSMYVPGRLDGDKSKCLTAV